MRTRPCQRSTSAFARVGLFGSPGRDTWRESACYSTSPATYGNISASSHLSSGEPNCMSCFGLEDVRRFVAAGAITASVTLPLFGQGTISGRVVVKGTDLPIGYSVVSLGDKNREQFTDGDGAFTLRNVAAGQIRF